MKSYSNTYIFIFSAVMVLVVATLLSFAAIKLKPFQEKNVEIAKKTDILSSVYRAEGLEDAEDKTTFIENQYNKYITDSYVLNYKGERQEGKEAFTIDLKVELAKPVEERDLPMFEYTSDDGSKKYIIPLRGKGLWGPIWGYVALDEDYNTIYGANFDHKSETPGLGAEIKEMFFETQFKGKKIFKEGEFVSVQVVKGGADPNDDYGVDAISGGTITSKGLQDMMENVLNNYVNYFESKTN